MTRQQFIALFGQEPIDMFGPDWENRIAEFDEDHPDPVEEMKKAEERRDELLEDHDCHLSPMDGCDCQEERMK